MSALPDNENQATPNRVAYRRCVQELQQPEPNYQAAQLYATLSVEEALQDVVAQLARLTRAIVSGSRRR